MVIRRHRLIELYLMQELGYELRDVHAEAERLEHAVSDQFIEAIDQKLGHPDIDPHGDPIPSAEGHVAQTVSIPLTELPANTSARISRLMASSPELLQHVVDREFRLGDVVEVTTRDPFHGPLTVLVNGRREILGYTVAASIHVDIV
jgi:DtxR family Mn-dependent transcriptional regulator